MSRWAFGEFDQSAKQSQGAGTRNLVAILPCMAKLTKHIGPGKLVTILGPVKSPSSGHNGDNVDNAVIGIKIVYISVYKPTFKTF